MDIKLNRSDYKAIKEYFPDGTPVSEWFYDYKKPELKNLGKKYILTDYGIYPDGKIHTEEIQALIDKIALNNGGLLVVPEGIFKTGALFFHDKVNLYLEKNGVILGSDDITDYPIKETRIEGETCLYYSALINFEKMNGVYIGGQGTIDGNGLKAWKSFWQRLKWNPDATNKDEQRPRLIYISECENVMLCDIRIQNSQFWSTHLYNCKNVKCFDCWIYSPNEPVPAPSTDGIDIDVCSNVLIRGCHIEVDDDGIVMKGGKGVKGLDGKGNGINENIIIEKCTFGFCLSCFTCGSESIYDKNIIIRDIDIKNSYNFFQLKMRTDTQQHFTYITFKNIVGKMNNFVNVNSWCQFEKKDDKVLPKSVVDRISFDNCNIECDKFFNIKSNDDLFVISDIMAKNMKISAENAELNRFQIKNYCESNVEIIQSKPYNREKKTV